MSITATTAQKLDELCEWRAMTYCGGTCIVITTCGGSFALRSADVEDYLASVPAAAMVEDRATVVTGLLDRLDSIVDLSLAADALERGLYLYDLETWRSAAEPQPIALGCPDGSGLNAGPGRSTPRAWDRGPARGSGAHPRVDRAREAGLADAPRTPSLNASAGLRVTARLRRSRSAAGY